MQKRPRRPSTAADLFTQIGDGSIPVDRSNQVVTEFVELQDLNCVVPVRAPVAEQPNADFEIVQPRRALIQPVSNSVWVALHLVKDCCAADPHSRCAVDPRDIAL